MLANGTALTFPMFHERQSRPRQLVHVLGAGTQDYRPARARRRIVPPDARQDGRSATGFQRRRNLEVTGGEAPPKVHNSKHLKPPPAL
jgi:hypothetical protein